MKFLTSLFFILFALCVSNGQVKNLRCRQMNDQKVILEWFFKGPSTTVSLERLARTSTGEIISNYVKVADVDLSEAQYIDAYAFNPRYEYVYKFTYEGEVFLKKAVIYDFTAFELLAPTNIMFYKEGGKIHLHWTDVSHREQGFTVFDGADNVLATAAANAAKISFDDLGQEMIYVAAQGASTLTEKVAAEEIPSLTLSNSLEDTKPWVAVFPNYMYLNGVDDFSNVDLNVNGFLDFLIEDASFRNRIDVLKFYSQIQVLSAATIQRIVDFQKDYNKMIAIEVGGIRQKNNVAKHLNGEAQADKTYEKQMKPIMDAGGKINYIETDNASLFALWGAHTPSPSITDPLNYTTGEVARELADFFRDIHALSPETKFGVIENIYSADFGSDWKGNKMAVGASADGVKAILDQLNFLMRTRDLQIHHFTAELPWDYAESFGFDDYNYYKMLAVSEYCESLGIRFAKLYNPNSSTASSEAFFNASTQFYKKSKNTFALKTYIDTFQSWIEYPTVIYSNEAPYSFTNIVKELIEEPVASAAEQASLIEVRIYPNPADDFVQVKSDTPFSTLELIDAVGKLILVKTDLQTNVFQLELSKLNPGVYRLAVGSLKGKIIKNIVVL